MSKTTTKKFVVKDVRHAPSKKADWRPVRAGTMRANILLEMTGARSVEEIARRFDIAAAYVMAWARCNHRDLGIGYEVRAGKIRALFPTGVTLKQAVVQAERK